MSSVQECLVGTDRVESLWDCPCIECWRLGMDVEDPEHRESYSDWRAYRIPLEGPR